MTYVLGKQIKAGHHLMTDYWAVREQDWLLIREDPRGPLVVPSPGFYAITTARQTEVQRWVGRIRSSSVHDSRRFYNWPPPVTVEIVEITGDPAIPGNVKRGQMGTLPWMHPVGAVLEAVGS